MTDEWSSVAYRRKVHALELRYGGPLSPDGWYLEQKLFTPPHFQGSQLLLSFGSLHKEIDHVDCMEIYPRDWV